MLDITDLCLIRVSFTCLKAVAYDFDWRSCDAYKQYDWFAKFENTMREFQIAWQNYVVNNSAVACGMREGEVGDVERGMGDVWHQLQEPNSLIWIQKCDAGRYRCSILFLFDMGQRGKSYNNLSRSCSVPYYKHNRKTSGIYSIILLYSILLLTMHLV